jgi:biopolymer transport protein ExbD
MKIRRRKRRSPADPGASSDLAFILIIYFIVIAGFNVNRGFLIDLPARDSTRLIRREDLLRFELDREGNILFENEERNYVFAENKIRSATDGNPDAAVMLTIDPAAPWQSVVSFVELARNLRIDSFSFAMKKEAGR